MDHVQQPTALEQEPKRVSPPTPKYIPPEESPKRRRKYGWIWWLVIAAVLVGGYVYWSKHKGGALTGLTEVSSTDTGKAGGRRGRGGGGAIPVVAVKATRGNIGVYYNGLGAVTPIYTVTIKSRVDGQMMAIHYKEGDLVNKGDLLVELDPRPFQVQLTQAEGTLGRDQALLANARIDQSRYETLLKQNAIPEQQLATQKALVTQYEGIVKTDQGAIDSAKLNLAYTHIEAPITGRIGLRLVDPGNIVHASDPNGLLVITQLQPISVIFTIAEDQLPAVLAKWRAGQRLRVDAFDRDMKTKLATGVLSTLDNEIDQTTGTLKLRATFNNERNELFPNQFVNARLLVEEKSGVVLVPTATIQRNTQMTYVWKVNANSAVSVQQVQTGTSEGDQTEVVSGLAPGDQAVMTGVDKLQEGTKVTTAQLDGAGGGAGGGRRGQGRPQNAGQSGDTQAPPSKMAPANQSGNGPATHGAGGDNPRHPRQQQQQ